MVGAAAVLRCLDARRVLLSVGRLDLEPFSELPGVHFLVRSVEAPPHCPPSATVVAARGPFTVEGERALLADHAIDALVTKDSGGGDAKLLAARAAVLPVVMVRRPPDVDGEAVLEPRAALAWVRSLRPPAPGPHGGDAAVLAAWLGTDPDAILDLSASLNPYAPDVATLVARSASRVAHYPDPLPATRALAGAIGVDPDRLVLTNGGAEGIALVASLEPVGSVGEPEFSLYARHLAAVARWCAAVAVQPVEPARPAGPGRHQRCRVGRGVLPAGHRRVDPGRRPGVAARLPDQAVGLPRAAPRLRDRPRPRPRRRRSEPASRAGR